MTYLAADIGNNTWHVWGETREGCPYEFYGIGVTSASSVWDYPLPIFRLEDGTVLLVVQIVE